MRKTTIAMAVMSIMAGAAQATTWESNYDIASAQTTIRFNDWGYVGPNGVGANDYKVGAGFNSSRIGQIQHVVTTGPDYKTPDPGHGIYQDLIDTPQPVYNNSNMDSQVNFYKWGYTTVAGSTFNNMQIDKAGNYHIAKNDMAFQFYDSFQYRDKSGVNPNATFDTNINFQPYAISDARGWCGSVLSSNPNNLEKMAGQVTFDFAFDAYLSNDYQGVGPGMKGNTASAIQIVPGFVMRSYGDYTVSYTEDGYSTTYTGSAVINNTDPLTGLVSEAYRNKVSFLGAGVVPLGVWININQVRADGTWDYSVAATQGADGTTDNEARGDGAVWHFNAFGGYAFLLRADGMRILDYVNPTGFSDYPVAAANAVPVPAAAWLMGSGLLGLTGFARRRNRVV